MVEKDQMDVVESLPFKENPSIRKIKQQTIQKTNSPLMSEKIQSKIVNQNVEARPNLIKKSKSFQLCSTPKCYNTQVTKELEILNLLFINGKI